MKILGAPHGFRKILVIILGLASTMALYYDYAAAVNPIDIVGGNEDGGFVIRPKPGSILLPVVPVTGPKGKVRTLFFPSGATHPEVPRGPEDVTKGHNPQGVPTIIPSTILHTAGPDTHATTGKVTYDMVLFQVPAVPATGPHPAKPAGTGLKVTVTPEIKPGNNRDVPVKIQAQFLDPIPFSDTHPEALFQFPANGINESFNLSAGTAFPSIFAPDLQSFGGVASDTFMTFMSRAAPSVVTDADILFAAGVAGAIDLFNLVLTSDANHNVTANLSVAQSTGDFLIDLQDEFGLPVDPTDVLALDAIEARIANSFLSGVLTSDLNDIFTVGLVPTASTSEFTLGYGQTYDITAVEISQVPEPSTLLLLGSGLLIRLWNKRLKRNCSWGERKGPV